MRNFIKSLLFSSIIALGGCSFFEDPYVQSGAAGGAIGTGVGAGTGALVGAAIANGDIAASAALGGAIGLPIGIVAGVAYKHHLEQQEIAANNRKIEQNYDYIVRRQQEINQLREDLRIESESFSPDPENKEYLYTGPTLGQYNRLPMQ